MFNSFPTVLTLCLSKEEENLSLRFLPCEHFLYISFIGALFFSEANVNIDQYTLTFASRTALILLGMVLKHSLDFGPY